MLLFFTSFGDDILLEESGRDDEFLVATAAMMGGGDVAYKGADDEWGVWFGFLNEPHNQVCSSTQLHNRLVLRRLLLSFR